MEKTITRKLEMPEEEVKTIAGLITATEAAKILRVHKNTVYELLTSGKLKGHRIIGNRWRIKFNDLADFINNNK